jgi:hypothetical protein
VFLCSYFLSFLFVYVFNGKFSARVNWLPSKSDFSRQTGWARFLWPADQVSILQPAAIPCGMQIFGFGLAMVESSRNTDADGRRMGEFKVNRHPLRSGAADVVVVVIVFHCL